jgi:RNA polymerase sigma factor (sigma-70 family)
VDAGTALAVAGLAVGVLFGVAGTLFGLDQKRSARDMKRSSRDIRRDLDAVLGVLRESPQPVIEERLARDTAPTDGDLKRQKGLLADAIGDLPEREKLVVTLYYYEELSLEEIAEVLGIPQSQVYQLHTKAILRLKTWLEDMS